MCNASTDRHIWLKTNDGRRRATGCFFETYSYEQQKNLSVIIAPAGSVLLYNAGRSSCLWRCRRVYTLN
jgi:hypothetical protein